MTGTALLVAAIAATSSVDIDALVRRMTLEEKVGQLVESVTSDHSVANGGDMTGREYYEKMVYGRLRKGEIGSFVGVPGAEQYNRCQRIAVEESRLGIPLLFGRGYCHGCHINYPIPLAMACAWEPELWRRMFESIAARARAEGVNWAFSPMLDLSRDARWGRIAEGPGCDPLIASLFAVASVRGLQGDDPSDGRHMAACIKHFVGYGAVEAGREYNGAEISDDTLYDFYLPPFKAAVEAGALTVMPAFTTVNGLPCSLNRRLLRDVLRGEFGFRGFTVSDWDAVGECGIDRHGLTSGDVDTAARALNAGMDVDMLSTAYAKGLAEAVRRGLVKESLLDESVRNVLGVKAALGLFEHPYLDAAEARRAIDTAAELALAREAARKCCVLLKNERGALPFGPKARIALGGPLADRPEEMNGCWTIHADVATNQSLYAGLKADGLDVFLFTRPEDAAAADAIVLALGERARQSGENTSRADIALPADQLGLLRAAKRTGRPVVAVVFSGRPLAIPEVAEEADAVVQAWQLGSCCGWGLADVMTGLAEPYGRLTIDFPRAVGQCPFYYNRLPTGRPNDEVLVYSKNGTWATKYIDAPLRAVFPFGAGLSYTRFDYSDETAEVRGDEVVFSATVANSGARRGSEVVQVYVRDRIAEVSRPRRELKGFARVDLKPGESRRVEIRVPRKDFSYHAFGRLLPGEGEFLAWIAHDSDSGRRLAFELK